MRNKTEVAAFFYTILGACRDAKPTVLKGVPNGHLYAQLMGQIQDLGEWQRLIAVMKGAGLLTESGHLLRITDKGEEVYGKLDAIIQSAQPKSA